LKATIADGRLGIAKDLAGVTRMSEVSEPKRKEAWRLVQKLLRKFHSLYVEKNFKSKAGPGSIPIRTPKIPVFAS
jgi:hypothetical protein